MKTNEPISIDIALIRELLHYEPSTGVFTWKVRPCQNVFAGDTAGGINGAGYYQVRVRGRMYKAHRLAYAHFHGVDPGVCVDHIDGNRANNAIANLRVVSHRANSQNRRASKQGSISPLLGVFPGRGSRWKASIAVEGGRIYLGTFETQEAAHAAYVEKKRQHHEGGML